MATHGVIEIIHYKALTLLLSGYSTQETADATGVDKQTIIRWKKQPQFQEMLSDGASKVFESAIGELVLTSKECAMELKKIALDPRTPARVKITAIVAILDNAAKVKTWALEKRIERVEKMLGGQNAIEFINSTEIGSESESIFEIER